MKYAFTMIELVFIIVIIGILAAVAIPKLAATRDDAIVASVASQIGVAVSDIAQYATARGKTEDDFTQMSDAVKVMIDKGRAVQNGNTLNIEMGNISDCLQLKVVKSTLDSNLTIMYGSSTNPLCDHLRSTIRAEDYPVPLKGKRTVF